MISKEIQFRIYSGTRKDDFTGWEKVDVDEKEGVDFWSLNLGNGYRLDRVIKHVKGFFGSKKKIHLNSIRRDHTIEDPDGEYKDLDYNILYDVDIMVESDSIKFNGKHNSFVLLSREPIDWNQFMKGEFKMDNPKDDNWSSFYS